MVSGPNSILRSHGHSPSQAKRSLKTIKGPAATERVREEEAGGGRSCGFWGENLPRRRGGGHKKRGSIQKKEIFGLSSRIRRKTIAAFFLVLASLFLWAPSPAVHTPSTQEGEIPGLPPWCCNMRDCKAADVRLLRVEGKTPIILVNGNEYKVVGRFGDGRRGIFITPEKQTYWCPMGGDKARCALIRPLGEM